MQKMSACVFLFTLFSLPLSFTLLAASMSHFLTTAIKFSYFSSNKIDFFCFLPPSVSIADRLNVEITFKRNNPLCCCCLSLNVRVAVQ